MEAEIIPDVAGAQKKQEQRNIRKISSSSAVETINSFSISNIESLISNIPKTAMGHNAHKTKSAKSQHSVLQTAKKRHGAAIDYRTCCLSNRSLHYNKTVSGCIAKLGKNAKLQKKAHFFNPELPIAIFGFLTIFKLACDTNPTHEGAVIWVLPHFVHKTLAIALSSHMYAEKSIAMFASSVRNRERRSRKL